MRQFAEKLEIEVASGKSWVQLFRIDAHELGLEAGLDHGARKFVRSSAPDWEKRFQTGAFELLLPVCANVFQK